MSQRNQTAQKKHDIMEAATRVLRDLGLQRLSFETVADEAGLSRQLVRYHFPTLDALMVDLCDHLGNAYREILVAGVVNVGQVERLDFFLDFFFDLAADHPMPENLETYDALVAYAVGSEPFRNRLCLQYKTLGQVMMHELAIAHPELDGHACEELSFVFVSMMHAHWSFVASLRHSRAHSHLAREAMKRLIQSYVDNPPEGPVIAEPWGRE